MSGEWSPRPIRGRVIIQQPMRALYVQVCGRVARGRGDPRRGPGQRPGESGQLQRGRGQIPAGAGRAQSQNQQRLQRR